MLLHFITTEEIVRTTYLRPVANFSNKSSKIELLVSYFALFVCDRRRRLFKGRI